MSGRGCVITVQVLGGAKRENDHEISLPVALHSPLEVLKRQLAELTGISIQIQVLILCDLSDVERNNDKELSGLDSINLREIGIKNNSYLTLHGVGLMESRTELLNEKMKKKLIENPIDIDSKVVMTPISAAQANHSYNGIIFDIESKGPFEVDILSLSVAGMLGRVRVFARDRPWEQDNDDRRNPNHWWAHAENVSKTGWYQVADETLMPSWDKPREIRLDTPVKLLPHSRLGFYLHSGLPDDLGIQYQSYPRKDEVFGGDDFINLYPGLGHTGSQPFDDEHGWYRQYRGLAGGVRYKASLKGWSPFEHKIFPPPLKESVIQMLLCQQELSHENDTSRDNCSVTIPIKRITPHTIYNICEYMHWDWFEEIDEIAVKRNNNEDQMRLSGRNSTNSAMQFVLNYLQNRTIGNDDDEEDDEDDEEEYDDEEDIDEEHYYNNNVMVEEDFYDEEDEDDEDDDDDDDDEDNEDDETDDDDDENYHDPLNHIDGGDGNDDANVE